MTYSHRQIEKKWSELWLKKRLFVTQIEDFSRPKFYILDMFPYPSGAGLHVGHIRGYLATDILARMKRMQGYNVLHPLGFDSFGLPTEQYAIKTSKDPAKFTQKNIANFIHQLKSLGFGYDYENYIVTSDPQYYQWTQWTFLQLYKKKIACLQWTHVNYCPDLNTVLANEEIINKNGQMLSERGEFPVFQKKQKQWVILLPTFADKLLINLQKLDWPESIKKIQTEWIGKTEGQEITLSETKDSNLQFSFFVGNPYFWQDALFLGISIENEKYDAYLSLDLQKQLLALRKKISQKNSMSKQIVNPNPLGLKTNWWLKNPITEKLLPVYFVEYIDADYAFGTALGRPLWNSSDWFFAHHHKIANLPQKPLTEKCSLSQKKWNKKLQKKDNNINKYKKFPFKTFFHIKNWVFSRQRYWGEPFPIRFKNGKVELLKENELPLKLPALPADFWRKKNLSANLSPLSCLPAWTKKNYDVNTMPQWAGSCWYFLAYILKKKNDYWPLNHSHAKKLLNHWMPVDLYVGGQEHAASHLIYARFWNRFLTEINVHVHPEPFVKLRNQGMILDSNGSKMSKSKNNVVNPLDFLVSHGADALRLHEKFLGPFTSKIQWDEKNLDSMRKWLARVYSIFNRSKYWISQKPSQDLKIIEAKLIKETTENYKKCFFNVAISKLMAFINFCYKSKTMPASLGLTFLKLLHPICPHITEEIFSHHSQNKKFLIETDWPTYDRSDLIIDQVNIVLQINGKLKGILKVKINSSEKLVISLAKNQLADFLMNRQITRYFFVPNKVVNFLTN